MLKSGQNYVLIIPSNILIHTPVISNTLLVTWLKLFACSIIFHAFIDFLLTFFKIILSGTLPECQTLWIQIRTEVKSVLIWVQTVCKGYQETTLLAKKEGDIHEPKMAILYSIFLEIIGHGAKCQLWCHPGNSDELPPPPLTREEIIRP